MADTAFIHGFAEANLSHLKELRLDNINITDNAFNAIFPRITNLTHFQITKCPSLLTNGLLQNIFKHLVNLQQLILHEYEGTELTFAGFGVDSENGFQINRLHQMRVLCLENFYNLDDRCLKTFKFDQLVDLSLNRCIKVSAI
jgi:hypothetical protein